MEEQERLKALPLISIIPLERFNQKYTSLSDLFLGLSKGELPSEKGREKGEYQEIELRKEYILLGKQIEYRAWLDDEQREKVESALLRIKTGDSGYALAENPVLFHPIVLRNVGSSAAVNLRSGINRKGNAVKLSQWKTLEPGGECYLGIYSDTSCEDVPGEYVLTIVYSDIFMRCYRQDHPITIKKLTPDQDAEERFCSSLEMKIEQRQVDPETWNDLAR